MANGQMMTVSGYYFDGRHQPEIFDRTVCLINNPLAVIVHASSREFTRGGPRSCQSRNQTVWFPRSREDAGSQSHEINGRARRSTVLQFEMHQARQMAF